MIGFFASNNQEHLKILEQVTELVLHVEEASPVHLIRCHELTEAVVRELREVGHDVNRTDGRYGHVAHSWIDLDLSTILDVYSIGRFPIVQLIDTSLVLPHRFERYGCSVVRTDIDEVVVESLREQMRAIR